MSGATRKGADPRREPGVAVPADRVSRFFRMGGLAGGIAGSVLAQGVRQVATGRRPRAADLLLTPANAQRVARELSRMRGAAMKVGQLMSMDAGDVFPPEIAAILERLRENAHPMPPAQLKRVLTEQWGEGWLRRFERFDVRPVAAASIGQVHRARTRDGRDLAIKVQYPGIRRSIDSDIDNIAALMRYSGALPSSVDLSDLFADAKRQLHEEADYAREADAMARFGDFLAGDDRFRVPRPHPDLSTETLLAMDFVESRPLGELGHAPQEVRDDVAARLIELVLRELFEFHAMQTDPNFANYRYQPETGRVVLLDFGATRRFDPALADAFRRLMDAGLAKDDDAAEAAARAVGLFDDATRADHRRIIMEMLATGMEVFEGDAPFDFARSDLIGRLRDMGLALGTEREFWHVPATDTLLVQRKVAGTYLLAARLGARVRLREIVDRFSRL